MGIWCAYSVFEATVSAGTDPKAEANLSTNTKAHESSTTLLESTDMKPPDRPELATPFKISQLTSSSAVARPISRAAPSIARLPPECWAKCFEFTPAECLSKPRDAIMKLMKGRSTHHLCHYLKGIKQIKLISGAFVWTTSEHINSNCRDLFRWHQESKTNVVRFHDSLSNDDYLSILLRSDGDVESKALLLYSFNQQGMVEARWCTKQAGSRRSEYTIDDLKQLLAEGHSKGWSTESRSKRSRRLMQTRMKSRWASWHCEFVHGLGCVAVILFATMTIMALVGLFKYVIL